MFNQHKLKKNRLPAKGFTLVELLIVVGILGTLTAIAIPLLSSYIEKARVTRAIAEIRMLEKEVISFRVGNSRLPNNLGEIGLAALNDPWGTPYQYLRIEGVKGVGNMRKDHFMVPVNTDFDLYSKGPDGDSKAPFAVPVSYDDIVRANDGQFVGPVYRY